MFTRETGIILACDVESLEQLEELVVLGGQYSEVVACKIGFALGLRYGLSEVVRVVKANSSLPTMYDHQKAGTDIPQMGKPLASLCAEAGVEGVIVFPLAGPKTLASFVTAISESGLEPIVGLVMTHAAFLQSEGGFIADSSPSTICEIAIQNGVRSFVLPGTKVDIVDRFAKGPLAGVKDVNIMMPGIGSQGGTITSAFEATKPHQRFAIIGSAIYGASDPKATLEKMVAEVN